MDKIIGFFRGGKTITIVAGLLLYMGFQTVNGAEIDQNVVNALLAGSIWTLRLGVKNGSKPPGTPG